MHFSLLVLFLQKLSQQRIQFLSKQLKESDETLSHAKETWQTTSKLMRDELDDVKAQLQQQRQMYEALVQEKHEVNGSDQQNDRFKYENLQTALAKSEKSRKKLSEMLQMVEMEKNKLEVKSALDSMRCFFLSVLQFS